jgi:hypothetical protein
MRTVWRWMPEPSMPCCASARTTSCNPAQRSKRRQRQGGRIVAAGAKRTTGLRGLVLNPVTVTCSRTAISNLDGFDRPWAHLERRLGPLQVEERLWGTACIARGIKT